MNSHQEHTEEVGADMLRDMNVTPNETSQFHLLPFKQIRDEDTGVHECVCTFLMISLRRMLNQPLLQTRKQVQRQGHKTSSGTDIHTLPKAQLPFSAPGVSNSGGAGIPVDYRV